MDASKARKHHPAIQKVDTRFHHVFLLAEKRSEFGMLGFANVASKFTTKKHILIDTGHQGRLYWDPQEQEPLDVIVLCTPRRAPSRHGMLAMFLTQNLD